MTKYKNLDPLLHSQLRLAVMSVLMNTESAEFTYIKEQTGATAGNLSIQISKLREAGYISVRKRFRKNYPQTLCKITPLGKKSFENYVEALSDYLKSNTNQ